MKKITILLICIIFFITIVSCGKSITYVNNKDDILKLQLENDNFIFFSFDKDKECIKELAKVLDENYNRITNNLNVQLKEKIIIEIYPDIKAFHNEIGMPDAPDWIVGIAKEKKIYMVSPFNPGDFHSYDSIMQVIVHEFTHVVTFEINSDYGKIPRWLTDGLATYEAKQIPDETYIKEIINMNAIPSLDKLNSNEFVSVGGYALSYTIVEYLVNEYGYDTIISLIKAPRSYKSITGKSKLEFQNAWKYYLKEKYE